jgi:solute carrier family 45 protein 1/2/4
MADEEPGSRGREEQKKPLALDGASPADESPDRVGKPIHEESPLLSPNGAGHDEVEGLINTRSLDRYDPFMETKSIWYMILLTISIGGLQLAWCVELGNGTPYLLSLGLSKSVMAFVWIAGPLTGALVQPYIGILSDNCRSSWGKRTPFMIAGATATIGSLLALAWVREIVYGFLGLFGASRESEGVKVTIIVVAVILIYILDFAINTGMHIMGPFRSVLTYCSASRHSSLYLRLLPKPSAR